MAAVIIREDLLDRVPANLPSLLDYKVMAENDSLYNTPPCFGIYMIAKVPVSPQRYRRLGQNGSHQPQESQTLYDAIDNSGGYYIGHADKESRSLMNVTFVLQNPDLESKFIKEATAADLDGLKGHRSVGGCRASIYNAITQESVDALVAFMKDFQQNNG